MDNSMMGQNIIITEPSKKLRTLGRNALAGKWKIAIIGVLIYEICIQFPPIILNAIFGINIMSFVAEKGYTYEMDAETFSQIYNSMPDYNILALVYLILVTGPLMLGLTIFFLALFRGHDVDAFDIFLGFEKFGKALGLLLYIGLFTFLWSLLFIIPGIIASIRYSQAFYILADDPTKGIKQCVEESKSMMRGNKAKYFWLTLSFIGWLLLACIPGSIVAGIGNSLSGSETMAAVCAMVGDLFAVPVTAYMMSTFAGFYEILSGHLIKETEPAPVDTSAIHIPEHLESAVAEEAAAAEEATTEEQEAEEEVKEEKEDSDGEQL